MKTTDQRSEARAEDEKFFIETAKGLLEKFGKLAAKFDFPSIETLNKLWNEYIIPGIVGARATRKLLEKKWTEPK
jgi:hypothetical protein